jgi:DNA-directed RNA polymerase specialized sigma24 family protein
VAETLGITQGTSKSQLFRAREMLRGWLGAEAEETA